MWRNIGELFLVSPGDDCQNQLVSGGSLPCLCEEVEAALFECWFLSCLKLVSCFGPFLDLNL